MGDFLTPIEIGVLLIRVNPVHIYYLLDGQKDNNLVISTKCNSFNCKQWETT